jgi:hypothetical protein
MDAAQLTAIAAIVLSLGTAGAAIITAWRNSGKIDDVKRTVQAVALTTAKIDGHVNSEKTAAEEQKRSAHREIELLREQLARERAAAQLLAQSVAQAGEKVALALTAAVPHIPIPVEVVNQPHDPVPTTKGSPKAG